MATGSLIATRLLPDSATNWLSLTPGALENLAGALWNQHAEMPLIREILKKAEELTDSPYQSAQAEPTAEFPTVGECQESGTAESLLPPVSLENNVPGEASGINVTLPEPAISSVPESALQNEVSFALQSDPGSVLSENEGANNEETSGEPEEQENAVSSESTDILLSMFSSSEDDHLSVKDNHSLPEDPSVESSTEETIYNVEYEENQLITDEEDNLPGKSPAMLKAQPSESDVVATGNEATGGGFLTWLTDGLTSGRISVNDADSRIHVVSGFVYLLVPDIFYLYLKESGTEESREKIQSSFEKLQLHRVRKGERFTRAKLYKQTDQQGKYTKVSGYLIKASYFREGELPSDSHLLSFP